MHCLHHVTAWRHLSIKRHKNLAEFVTLDLTVGFIGLFILDLYKEREEKGTGGREWKQTPLPGTLLLYAARGDNYFFPTLGDWLESAGRAVWQYLLLNLSPVRGVINIFSASILLVSRAAAARGDNYFFPTLGDWLESAGRAVFKVTRHLCFKNKK